MPRAATRNSPDLISMDFKRTLNLPRTDFPPKAGPVAREPQQPVTGKQARLHESIQPARAGDAPVNLHQPNHRQFP